MRDYKLLGLISYISIVIAVFFDAMSDGMRNSGDEYFLNWHTSKAISMMFYFVAVCSYIAKEFTLNEKFYYKGFAIMCIIMLVEFVGIRFCIFNYVHNYFFGVNIFYIGKTSFIDSMYLKYIVNYFPPTFVMMFKFFIFTVLFIRISSLFKN